MTNQDRETADGKPVIAYVDEQEDERDNFFHDAFDTDLFADIKVLHPEPQLENMIGSLLELGIDALVTDYRLNDLGGIDYDGEELVQGFLDKRHGFPCFVRTSYEQYALQESGDVNRVYSKDQVSEEHAGRSIFPRVFAQVQNHRRALNQWQEELEALLGKDLGSRSMHDVERILVLDDRIESYCGKDMRLPIATKRELLRPHEELVNATELLVKKIKKELGD